MHSSILFTFLPLLSLVHAIPSKPYSNTTLSLSTASPTTIISNTITTTTTTYTPAATTAFVVEALKFNPFSGRDSITNQFLAASSSNFYIGNSSSTACPLPPPQCPSGTSRAAISCAAGYCNLDVSVPGGQQIYVAANGALSFTQAGVDVIPAGGVAYGFMTTYSTFGFPRGLLACPVAAGETVTIPSGFALSQVFVNVPGLSDADVPGGNVKSCVDFHTFTFGVTSFGAYEYV